MVWAVFSARCRACKHQTGVSGTGHEMSARTQEIGGRGHLEARSSPWWSSPEEAGDTQPSAQLELSQLEKNQVQRQRGAVRCRWAQ